MSTAAEEIAPYRQPAKCPECGVEMESYKINNHRWMAHRIRTHPPGSGSKAPAKRRGRPPGSKSRPRQNVVSPSRTGNPPAAAPTPLFDADREETPAAAEEIRPKPAKRGLKDQLTGWLRGSRPEKDPERPKRQRRSDGKRVSTAPAGALAWSTLGALAGRAGQIPVAKVMGIQSPAAGMVIDRALAGTMVDTVLQPLVADSQKWSQLAMLAALPVMVAMHSSRPTPLSEAAIAMLVKPNAKQIAQAMREAKAEQEDLDEVTQELRASFGADLFPEGQDAVTSIVRWIFQPEPTHDG